MESVLFRFFAISDTFEVNHMHISDFTVVINIKMKNAKLCNFAWGAFKINVCCGILSWRWWCGERSGGPGDFENLDFCVKIYFKSRIENERQRKHPFTIGSAWNFGAYRSSHCVKMRSLCLSRVTLWLFVCVCGVWGVGPFRVDRKAI